MNPRFIDLHIHTTASDGSDSPTQVVAAAASLGLAAIAITDHDTTDGLDEAARAAGAFPLEFIRGVELSVATPLDCEVHLLGLRLPPSPTPDFTLALEDVRLRRKERNLEMIARMQALGLPVTLEYLQSLTPGHVLGRPHMAQALINRGLVKSRQEAFSRYLGAGAPAWVPRVRMPIAQALSLLQQTGAVSSLAHPCLIRCNRDALVALIASLVPLGLRALEAYHPEHSPADVAFLVKLAAQYKLALTGGSDYHGHARSGVAIGRGKGSLRVSASLLAALQK